jgi:hypothetical protein
MRLSDGRSKRVDDAISRKPARPRYFLAVMTSSRVTERAGAAGAGITGGGCGTLGAVIVWGNLV